MKASVNGIEISYEILGADKPGTPLVMTHGFAGPSAIWRPELAPLAEKRPLVIYDVRGHGSTSAPESLGAYTVPQFASDLAGLVREIGIERAHIGGESMGGIITAQFAVDFPEFCETVLLCDTTCGNGVGDGPAADYERFISQGVAALSHMVQKYGFEETIAREQEWKVQNDPHLDVSPYTIEDDYARLKLMTTHGYIGAAHALAHRPDLTGRVGAINVPTLVMIGGWDGFLPCAERDHKLIPNSRFVLREECGHGTRWRLETFQQQIEAFLDDVEAGRPVAGERRV